MRGAGWWIAIAGLVGCGTGPGGTGPIVVSGRVLDLVGRPFPNVTVLVGSRPSVVTDAAGAFSVTEVSTPYDLTAIPPPNILITTLYRGLTRRDPTLVFGFVQPQQDNSGYLTGTIVGGAAPGTLLLTTWLAWASPEIIVSSNVDPAFSLLYRWNGPSTSAGRAHALQWIQDAEGLPSTYTGAAEASTALQNGGATPPITLSLQPVTTASLSGSVSSPAAYPLAEIDLAEYFPDGAFVSLGFDMSPSSSFSYAIPDGIGATTTVIASSSLVPPDTAYTSTRRSGVTAASGALAITLPSPAELTSPAQGATGVTAATEFSWTPLASAIYRLEVRCGRATVRTYTQQTTARVPDLSAQGLGLPPGATCQWRVYAQTAFGDMDEFAGNPRWAGSDFSGSSTWSAARSFTIP